MSKKYFSKASPFINRKKEQEYINSYLQSNPESILRVYGPKSTGKTTMVRKITNDLGKDYVVSSINFRGYLIGNYDMFVTAMFDVVKDFEEKKTKMSRWDWMFDDIKKELEKKRDNERQESTFDFKLFKINTTQERKLREKTLDPFQAMTAILENIKNKGKKPVIVFDEIQELRDLYMNGDKLKRSILKEIFAFFIRLTKELHLCHVICMTSESTFIDEIYNSTKLKNTSDFYRVDHLEKKEILTWMKDEGMTDVQADLVRDNLGGSPQEIRNVLVKRKNSDNQDDETLKELLDRKVNDEKSRIEDIIMYKIDSKYVEELEEVNKILVKEGKYIMNYKAPVSRPLLEMMVEKDLWFYDSFRSEIVANSQSVRKAMEIMKS